MNFLLRDVIGNLRLDARGCTALLLLRLIPYAPAEQAAVVRQ